MKYWWVSQGKNFRHERDGGYLWAPKRDAAGRTPFHWANMMKVRKGDVVYSYVNQSICAVGVATSQAHDFMRPEVFEKEWERDGCRVTMEYRDVRPPKPLADFVSELMPLLPPQYGPLNVNGHGAMGYLFELPQEAGELVARAIELRSSGQSVARTSPASLFQPGQRVLNPKFGLGTVANVDGNRLTVEFDTEGRKIVVDSFVERVS
ncbi:MAG TPA: DUF3553 domain-containing protein [Microvirga sp.]|jgi:hypothetical protein|nr:DUF3553 domain-containing protein [Microvirga sp.]